MDVQTGLGCRFNRRFSKVRFSPFVEQNSLVELLHGPIYLSLEPLCGVGQGSVLQYPLRRGGVVLDAEWSSQHVLFGEYALAKSHLLRRNFRDNGASQQFRWRAPFRRTPMLRECRRDSITFLGRIGGAPTILSRDGLPRVQRYTHRVRKRVLVHSHLRHLVREKGFDIRLPA